MIWVVDKTIARHLLNGGELMGELPLRVSFEYALEAGSVVDGSVSIRVLYNSRSVDRFFPHLDSRELEADVGRTATAAVEEHLVMNGFGRDGMACEPELVPVH